MGDIYFLLFIFPSFNSVKLGNHTLFREYAFISATPHNRSSFVRTFWKCFQNIGRKGGMLNRKKKLINDVTEKKCNKYHSWKLKV